MPTVYVTAPRDDARDIADRLVSERLAACVNVVDCESTYRWEGEVHHDDEAVLLAKTTDEACEALMARVEEVHPYDVPSVERFDESRVTAAFTRWREDVVD